MNVQLTKIFALSAMAGISNKLEHQDISTKIKTETCPNCRKQHKSNKHLFCCKKCFKEYHNK